MILKKADEINIDAVKKLYDEAFPANERKPFEVIEKNRDRGITEILSIENDKNNKNDKDNTDDIFRGLVITIMKGDLVLVDYFAVDPNLRGQGTGATALELIRQRYASKRVFLEIELPGEQYDNNDQRIRRKAFYLRNGLKPSGIHTRVYETDMELLIFDKPISFEEYCGLFKMAMGERIKITGEPVLLD